MIWFCLMVSVVLADSTVPRYVPRNLGPFHIHANYGTFTPKYETLTSNDIQASTNLGYFVERFRSFFKTGFGEVPPLDPFHYPNSTVTSLEDYDIQGAIHFSQFSLTGAQQFYINTLELRLDAARIDISVDFPILSTNVNFTAGFKVDELRNDISGHANITFNNVRMIAALQFEAKPPGAESRDQILSVSAIRYDLYTTNAQYNLRDDNFQQVQHEQPTYQRIRSSIQATASLLVKEIALEIAEIVSNSTAVAFVSETDQVLSHYYKGQILAMLLPMQYNNTM